MPRNIYFVRQARASASVGACHIRHWRCAHTILPTCHSRFISFLKWKNAIPPSVYSCTTPKAHLITKDFLFVSQVAIYPRGVVQLPKPASLRLLLSLIRGRDFDLYVEHRTVMIGGVAGCPINLTGKESLGERRPKRGSAPLPFAPKASCLPWLIALINVGSAAA